MSFPFVDRDVRLFRAKNNRKVRRERWWQFAERAPGLYKAIAHLDRVLVVSQVTKYFTFLPVLQDQVYNERLVIFSSNSQWLLALLSSSIHESWALIYGTTQENRPTSFPERCTERSLSPSIP